MAKCMICQKPIVLMPSAKERAAKDVTGKTAKDYEKMFTTHSECLLKKREEGTRACEGVRNETRRTDSD